MRYDDEPSIRHDPPFPATVLTAGIIWILFGSLLLAGLLVVVLFALAVAACGAGDPSAAISFAVAVGAVTSVFGAGFVYNGVQTVRGTSPDVTNNGVSSIVVGLPLCAALLASAVLEAHEAAVVVGYGTMSAAGLTLLAAGVLALVGRAAYRDWRLANRPPLGGRYADERDPPRWHWRDEDDDPPR